MMRNMSDSTSAPLVHFMLVPVYWTIKSCDAGDSFFLLSLTLCQQIINSSSKGHLVMLAIAQFALNQHSSTNKLQTQKWVTEPF